MRIPFPSTGTRTTARAKRPMWRRAWLLIPLALIVVGAFLFWRSRTSATPTAATTTGQVTQGTISATVSGSGTVAAARTADLTFAQGGTVTAVNIKVGDSVAAGQALATIDPTNLKLALQQAQANLKSAQASAAQTQTGTTTDQDRASAQAALDSAKAQLQQTRTGTATAADITSAKAALASAQAKLDALRNPAASNLATAQSQITQAQTSLQSTQNSASQTKTNAELSLQNAVNSLTQAQSKFSTAQQNWQHVQDSGTDPANPTTTSSSGKKVPNTLNDAERQQYYDAFVSAQAALDSAQNSVTQAQVAYDAARQKEVTDIAQAQATVQSAQQDLTSLQNPTASDLTQAQAAVTQAQASLTKLTQGGTASDITKAQASVTQAQASLEKLNAPATAADLAGADASVLQAQVNVDTAQRALDEATLTAPFAGVVSAVTVQQGVTAGTTAAAVSVIDSSTLHINVSLSEADAAKAQVGQPVTLSFDAVPDTTLQGKITTISPSATTAQNVVTYPVQIEFDPGKSAIKVGMSATADIQTQQIENAILVPSRAIKTSGTNKTVTILQGPQRTPVVVPVKTGLTSDGLTQIISSGGNNVPALKAGDVVSITSTATTTTTTTNNRGGFGGGQGGPPPGL